MLITDHSGKSDNLCWGLLFGIVFVLGLMCGNGCGKQKAERAANQRGPVPRESPQPPPEVRVPEAKGEIIKVAVIYAATGDASLANKSVFTGVRLAADEINAQGGIHGKKIQLLPFDNRSESLGAKEAAQRAVAEKVIGVVGPARSSFSLACAPVLQKHGIVMVTPTASNPKVTAVGDCIFRICFRDDFQGKLLAIFARKHLKATTAYLVVNANRIYSMGLVDIFAREFPSRGGRIVGKSLYLDASNDFRDILHQIRAVKPDVVFMPSESRDVIYFLKQAYKLKVEKLRMLGSDAWSELPPEYMNIQVQCDAYYSAFWHPTLKTEKSRLFVQKYRRFLGNFESDIIPLSYDAMWVLADALRRARRLDRQAVREALAATRGFQGVTGTITFDKNGDPVNRSAVIMKWVGKKRVFVTAIDPSHINTQQTPP
ncbi:MAG: hypothetical protein D6820_07365 [Lentisphaerae bacterium]|nr:MAG: hypothetical protein D6820_07365 [Lentisphaerota bacterium]